MKNLNQILLSVMALLVALTSYGQIIVTPENDATTLANSLIGSESSITIVSASFAGHETSAGTFTGGDFGINEGILLTSGGASLATGPNIAAGTSQDNGSEGDVQLDILSAPFFTQDACVLTIAFIPDGNSIEFSYVFASEEYNEWVCSSYNDVFGFFVDGGAYSNENIALIPGTAPPIPVAINNVNNGTIGSLGDPDVCSELQLGNSAFYVDNTDGTNIEYDGYTVTLTAVINVEPGTQYTIKLAIADAGDGTLDSGVFLEGESFISVTCDAGEVDADMPENFCPGNVPESITPSHTSANGENDTYLYVVSDESGMILAVVDEGDSFNPQGWDPGTYAIMGVSYSGTLFGVEEGGNTGNISANGCFDTSDPLTFTLLESCDEFECPELGADIGDTCDDGNPDTENDMVIEGCVCAGTAIEYDCPELGGNYGDPCTLIEPAFQKTNAGVVGMGIIGPGCNCIPQQVNNCVDWEYFLADFVGGVTTIYKVALNDVTQEAVLTELKTLNYEAHIAYNANDGLLYLVRKSDGSFRTLVVTVPNGALSAETALSIPMSGSVEAAFATNGKLVIGSQSSNEFVSVSSTGVVSPYATGDISGGDIVFDSSGQAYMATRSSGVLYEINPGFVNQMIGSVPSLVTGLSLKDDDSFLVSAKGSSQIEGRTNAGANNGAYDIILNGSSFTTSDGDMASGCAAGGGQVGDCQNFLYYYIADNTPGIPQGNVYEGAIIGGDFVLTYAFNAGMSGHIALNNKTGHPDYGNIYVINSNGDNLKTFTPGGTLVRDVSTSLPNTPALVFNPADGMVYAGSPTNGTVYAIDPITGSHSTFATGLPIRGGDLVFKRNNLNVQELFLVERTASNPSKLWNITTGIAVFVANVDNQANGAALTDLDGFITAEGNSTLLHTFDANGVPLATLNAVDAGANPFSIKDGDMASGCMDQQGGVECQNFLYYYIADNTPGIPQGNIYKGDIIGNDFVLTYAFNAGMSGHIALNTNNGNIYVINTNGSNLKTFNSAGIMQSDINIGLSATVALVWDPSNGMLYTASNNQKVYQIDPFGTVTLFASGLPVSGGDLVLNNAGELFLVARDGSNPSHLYNITTGIAVPALGIDVAPAVNGAAITDTDGFIMAEGLNSKYFHTYDGAGAPLLTLNAVDNGGNPFPVVDGDMASGCMGNNPLVQNCTYEMYYAHDASNGGNTDIYKMTINPNGTTTNTLIPGLSLAYTCQAVAVSPSGLLYIVNRNSAGTYIVWDLNTNSQVGGTFNMKRSGGANIGNVPTAAYHNGILYVGSTDGNIYAVNPLTGIAATWVSGNVNGGDLFFDDNNHMWLINRSGGTFYNLTLNTSFNVGIMNINGAALLPNGHVVVADGNGGSLFHEINLSTKAVTGVTYDTGLPLNGGDLAGRCTEGDDLEIPGDCYAAAVESYVQGTAFGGGSIAVNRTNPNEALGAPERTDQMVFVSLGYGGSLILSFNGAIPNGAGDDIEVIETTFNNSSCITYPEYANVYVSVDGINYAFAKTICRANGFVDITDAGAFTYVNYVKIVNNDVMSTTPDAFDVDGVVALHNCVVAPRPDLAIESNTSISSYPNPTTGDSQVIFSIPTSSKVTIAVYDMNGRIVKTIFDQTVDANQEYRIDFDGSGLPNGVYIYKLTTNEDTKILKFMIAH